MVTGAVVLVALSVVVAWQEHRITRLERLAAALGRPTGALPEGWD